MSTKRYLALAADPDTDITLPDYINLRPCEV